jgi:hypothetical protein
MDRELSSISKPSLVQRAFYGSRPVVPIYGLLTINTGMIELVPLLVTISSGRYVRHSCFALQRACMFIDPPWRSPQELEE